jgi:hypothetical protein
LAAGTSNPCRERGASVRVQLVIDGEVIYQDAEAIAVNSVPAGDALIQVQFAFTNIHKAMESYRLATGDAAEHTVELRVLTFYFGSETIFFYDAAEAPSGMVFNPEKVGPYTAIKVIG